MFCIYGVLEWGDGAAIGFDAGDGLRSFNILTNQSTLIGNGSNVGRIGLYIYQVDSCRILGPFDSGKLYSDTAHY